jgi:hypothetical protein
MGHWDSGFVVRGAGSRDFSMDWLDNVNNSTTRAARAYRRRKISGHDRNV